MIKLKALKIVTTAVDWFVTNKRMLIFIGLVTMAIVGMVSVFGRLFYFSVCMYVAWYVWKHRESLGDTRFIDWINPVKWASVLWATFAVEMYPFHIVEQMITRMFDKECRKCMENGSCLHCGCDMSKVYTPWDWCTKGNWGAMIESEKEYREMREEFPVEISVRYPREEANK